MFIPGERDFPLKAAKETAQREMVGGGPGAEMGCGLLKPGHQFKRPTLLPAFRLPPPLHPLPMLRSLCITTMDNTQTLCHIQSLLLSVHPQPIQRGFPNTGGLKRPDSCPQT